MFIGECKLYIININKDLITNENVNNWEANSLILNIGEDPNMFYTVDNNGKIKNVKLV